MEKSKFLKMYIFRNNYLIYLKSFVYILINLLIFTQNAVSQSPAGCDILKIGKDASHSLDCNIDPNDFTAVCLKLKFHFIKYQGTKEEFPSDGTYVTLLDGLNEIFGNGNIKFTFAMDCIDYIEYNNTFNTGGYVADRIERRQTILGNKTTFGFDEDAINIYSYVQAGGGEAARGENFLFSATNLSAIAHELGHTLGLWHTFGKGNPDYYKSPFSHPWVYKDGKHESGYQGDDISDTGADPYTMDLDNDNLADESKWINGSVPCSQNIDHTLEDDCDDSQTEWNIPFNNWMSYYGDCKKCFTHGQFEKMHDYIETYFQNAVQTECENDPYFSPTDCQAADITISIPTEWADTTIEMCKNQKIIIEAGGTLTLRNCKLNKKPGPITACPGLSKYGDWDGIYITQIISGNNPGNPSLYVLENSVITSSLHGINAYHFDKIVFDQSVMKGNKAGIKASHGTQGVFILNNSVIDGSSSTINFENSKKYKEISLINCFGKVSSSIVAGQGRSTGIYSYFGGLRIENHSQIKNFETVIYKDADKMDGGFTSPGGSGSGLYLNSSNLYASIDRFEAVYLNGVKDVIGFNNSITGTVRSRGKGTAVWEYNVLSGIEDVAPGVMELAEPELAYQIKDNLLNRYRMDFYGKNGLSNAVCNSWVNPEINAVYVNADPFIESWGKFNESSGNQVTSNHNPNMVSIGIRASNYFNTSQDLETKFVYLGSYIGNGISLVTSCNYRQFGDPGNEEYIEVCDDENAEGVWDSLETLEVNLLAAIELEQDSIELKHFNENLDQVLLNKSLLAVNMLRCHRQDSLWSNEGNLWMERLDEEFFDLNAVSEFFNIGDFESIETYNSESISDISDFEKLQDISQLLYSYAQDSLDIYDLDETHLDSVVKLAQESFGNYSNLIRAWLNAFYGIRIDWPEYSNQYSRGLVVKSKLKEIDVFVLPNLIQDCFRVQTSSIIDQVPISIKILDLNGYLLFNDQVNFNQQICLPVQIKTGIFILQLLIPGISKPISRRVAIIY
jgi:hypothetical protein